MARTFAITTNATDLKADANGKAEAVFTVTNTSSRPIRGLAKAKAMDNTKQEWLDVKGESERDFAPGATQQFVVGFNGPKPISTNTTGPAQDSAATAPAPVPAKYKFRLDVSSAVDPDEDFTEGPVVTVEAAVKEKKEEKKFPLWIIPIAAVVLIGIGVGLYFALRNGDVEVPNVIGLPLADARTAIEEAKLVAVEKETQVTGNASVGQVIDQEPKAEGGKVKPGSEVNLIIEGEAMAQVPNVLKLLEAEAKQKITESGLVPVTTGTKLVEGFQPKQVVTQTPEADQKVPLDSEVTIAIATKDEVKVPKVTGLTLTQAKKVLAGAGLTFHELTPQLADSTVPVGSIKSQNPKADAMVPPQSSIGLAMAAKGVQVPVITGKTVSAAHLLLQPKGLETYVYGTVSPSTANTVIVKTQFPKANTTVPMGSKVWAFVACPTKNCKPPTHSFFK